MSRRFVFLSLWFLSLMSCGTTHQEKFKVDQLEGDRQGTIKVEKPPLVSRPQEPKRSYPYDEKEVFYENKKAGVKLAGTLTLPRLERPFPAVLLISGGGAQDRNETVFGHRPFLVLADYLSRHGIAVLRVDDRGVGGSSGNTLESTIEDLSGDVLAGIDFLKKHEKIDPDNIGLIGHSEGGIIAPMVAVESEDVSFIVLMAGMGLTLEEFSYLQVALISRSVGKSEEEIAKNRAVMEEIYEVVKKEKNNERAGKKLRDIYESSLAGLSETEKASIGDLEVYINNQIQNVLSPGIRYLLTYDPRATLMKVRCPVLAIIGEKDLHVSPEENLRATEEALLAGGNKACTVKMLPGLNHLFQTTETGLISEYGEIEETISPKALKLIREWIFEKIKPH